MTTPLDEAIRLTVDYITNRAQHYFSIVRSKSDDGVLWFSFTYDHDGLAALLRQKKYCTADEASRAGLIGVKRTAFLPMSAIQSTDAKPLLDMTSRCDRRQQFVAWFTLEMADGSGQAQVSKVIVVDTLFASVPTTHNQHGASTGAGAVAQSRFASSGAPPSSSRNQTPNRRQAAQPQPQNQSYRDPSESAIDDLRRDMQETAANLRQQQYHASLTPTQTLGQAAGVTPRGGGGGYTDSPPRAARAGGGGGGGGGNSNYFGGGGGSPDAQQNPSFAQSAFSNNNSSMGGGSDPNYAHLLKVSLQISDSVAKLSQRVDGMMAQFNKFEQHLNKELYDMRMKVQRVDSDVATVRPKMAEITESTAHFGTRIGHLRQEMQAMFEGVSRKVNALSDSVISRNLQFTSSGNFGGAGGATSTGMGGGGGGAASFSSSSSLYPQQQGSSSYSQAMAAAERVNMDELLSRHSVDPHSQSRARAASMQPQGGSFGSKNVSFADDLVGNGSSSSGLGGHSSQSRRQDALDRLLNNNEDGDGDGMTFESRKKALALREMSEFKAQDIVDDFRTVARDLNENNAALDNDISVANVHRHKASMELARQDAANRSEAQAIAASYMHERNNALGASTTDLRGGVPDKGVPVPLEVSSSSVGAGPVVVSDSHRGPMFGGGGGGGSVGGRNSTGGGGSLSDLIASMERKLQS